jgi:hypothetical protein
MKFPAGVRDDTRAPLVRERSKTDTGSGDNPGWAAAASVTGPKSLPRSVSNFFFHFLLFLFCYFDLFITFAFWIQIASVQFLNFSKNQGNKLGQ